MGAKKASTKRKKKLNRRPRVALAKRNATEQEGYAVFESGPGKPTLRKDRLFHLRESLIGQIEPRWWAIGLALMNAKTLEDVRKAFESADLRTSCEQLTPILRKSFELSTSAGIRQTEKSLIPAVEASYRANNEHQKQFQKVQELERVHNSLSDHFVSVLEEDLARRKGNVRNIRIEIVQAKGVNRQLQEADLARLHKDLTADLAVCEQLQQRIKNVTPERQAIVAEELAEQKRLLLYLEKNWQETDTKLRDLQRQLDDQKAYYFRSQILWFVRTTKYAYNPRNLACAIAGLPYVTARRSLELCSRLESKIAVARDHEVFLFIESVWKRSRHTRPHSLVEYFKRQIRALPKFHIFNGQRRENHFRIYLCENWYFLMRALEESDREKFTSRGTAYLITGAFFGFAREQVSPVDSILAQRESIKD